jgi:hypothetical protein
MVFTLALLLYYLGFTLNSSWLSGVMAVWPVLLGYISAREVPYNLWLAYGELKISTGAIFFTTFFFGPFLGTFFYNFYSYLMQPLTGIIIILLAVGTLAALMEWQKRKTGKSIIPAHVWAAIIGVILVLYDAVTYGSTFNVVALANLVLVMVLLLAWESIHVTLAGGMGLLLALGIIMLSFKLNIWISLIMTLVMGLAWWMWGKRYLWFPIGFWVIVVLIWVSTYLIGYRGLSEVQASVMLTTGTLTVLWLQKRSLQ